MHVVDVARTFFDCVADKMTRMTAAQLVDLYRRRDHQDLLVSAHRGYRWSGVPENVRWSLVQGRSQTDLEVSGVGHSSREGRVDVGGD